MRLLHVYTLHSFVQRYDELRQKITSQQKEYLRQRVGLQLAQDNQSDYVMIRCVHRRGRRGTMN